MKFNLILKSGVAMEVTTADGRDITGLWIWMSRQITEHFLNFVEGTVRASDISMIQLMEDEEGAE